MIYYRGMKREKSVCAWGGGRGPLLLATVLHTCSFVFVPETSERGFSRFQTWRGPRRSALPTLSLCCEERKVQQRE